MAYQITAQTAVAATRKYAKCYQQLASTVKRTFLWGLVEEDNTMTNANLHLISNTTKECYVYQPGDVCNVLEEGYDLLWLRQIRLQDISVVPTRNGKVQVSYQGKPIIRMRGVDLIRTEDGCYSLDHWLAVA